MEDKPYSFQSLLVRDSKGEVTGPMSPILFMQAMREATGFRVNRVIRVSWKNSLWYQVNEGSKHRQEWTGYDFLVGASVTKNNKIHIALFLDLGGEGMPIMLAIDDKKDPITTPIYEAEKHRFFHKATNEQLVELVNDLRKDMRKNPSTYFPYDLHQDRLTTLPLAPDGKGEAGEDGRAGDSEDASREQLPHQDGDRSGQNA